MIEQPTFFGLEPLILERLKQTVAPIGVHVYGLDDVARARDKSLAKPAVACCYLGHNVIDQGVSVPGMSQIEQTWLLIAAVRNVRKIKEGTPSRIDVSPLVDLVWDSFDGWRPGKHYSSFKSASPNLAVLTIDGVTFLPLAFSCRFRRQQPCP